MIFIRVLSLALAFILTTTTVDAGFWETLKGWVYRTTITPPPTIDVLIVKDQPGVLLEVKGRYRIYDPNTKEYIGRRHMGKKKYFQSISSGVKWGEEFPGIYQLHIVPENQAKALFIDGIEYKGSIFIYNTEGSISIVNRVDIEDYLDLTLPQHLHDGSLAEETLAAIAITARTNAYYLSQHPRNKFWAIDSAESKFEEMVIDSPSVERAIKMTRYMVLSKRNTGDVTPFPAQWGTVTGVAFSQQQGFSSHISIKEAEKLGENSKHAAQILAKAFPGTHIELIH